METCDLHWAAGFLEGEGYFGYNGSPVVTAGQVNPEPLEKLKRLFGGTVLLYQRRHGWQPIWIWRLGSHPAAALQMTLYSLLSAKRKLQIRPALKQWKAGPGILGGYLRTCRKRHAWTQENTFTRPDGYRECRTCRAATKKRWQEKRKHKRIR